MSRHAAFRRQPVDPQVMAQLKTIALPAPTRGLVLSENEAYMQPGGALVLTNWAPTLRGIKLRGGLLRYNDLHALDTPSVPPVPSASRAPVISAFEYDSGTVHKMFAANNLKLFDVTTSMAPALVKGGNNSGNWAACQFANAGGEWLIAVNDYGDPPLRYNPATVGPPPGWCVLDATGITIPPASNAPDGASYSYGPART